MAQDLRDYLPHYYGDSVIVGNVLDRDKAELDTLNRDVADVLAQFFIDTATWGLTYWERELGLVTDETKPIEQRRAVVRSKLRGIGTVTVELIKNVALAYENGEVAVTEDNANYTIVVQFISALGVPDSIGDIQNAIREIIPAHMGISYIYRYYLVSQIHGTMTLNTLQSTKLNKFAPFTENLP